MGSQAPPMRCPTIQECTSETRSVSRQHGRIMSPYPKAKQHPATAFGAVAKLSDWMPGGLPSGWTIGPGRGSTGGKGSSIGEITSQAERNDEGTIAVGLRRTHIRLCRACPAVWQKYVNLPPRSDLNTRRHSRFHRGPGSIGPGPTKGR